MFRIKQINPVDLADGQTIAKVGGNIIATALQPTNQAVPIAAVKIDAGGTGVISTSSTTYVDIGSAGSITVPFTAPYIVMLNVMVDASGATADAGWRVSFAGATVSTVGCSIGSPTADQPDLTWYQPIRTTGFAMSFTAIAIVTLNAGATTVQLKFNRAGLTGTVNYNSAGHTPARVTIFPMGGTATFFQDVPKDAFHTTTVTSAFADTTTWHTIETGITSGSLTAPSSGDFQLRVVHCPYALVSGDPNIDYRLLIDGSPLTMPKHWSNWTPFPSNRQQFVGLVKATLASGSHTWELQWKRSSGANQARVDTSSGMWLSVEGGAAFGIANVRHQSHVTATISAPSSTTWAGIDAIIDLVDEVTHAEIARSTDSFTFSRAGTYRIDYSMNYATSSGGFVGLRLRRTSGTPATLLKRVVYQQDSADYNTADLRGIFTVSAGDVLQLQYCRSSGTGAAFGAVTVDGEAMSLARLTIELV